MEAKLVLIDGNSILNRAFYGVPDLTNREGLHTNAIYGFLNILFKVIDEEAPTHLLIAFDVKQPTFRHKLYDAYKGTRKPMAEELRQQVPVIKEVLQAMNITICEQEGIEADDILGTMSMKAEREGFQVSVVSGDRDLLQLATDKVLIRIPKTKGGQTLVEDYTPQTVLEKYGVTPAQIIDLKGLMGDSSDNIPGVPGIGEKTAVKILSQFQTVEEAIEHVGEISANRARDALKNNIELAQLSKKLATIKTDCEISVKLENTVIGDMFNKDVYTWIQKLEFKSMLSKFDSGMGNDMNAGEAFYTVTNREELQTLFKECANEDQISIKLLFQREGGQNIEPGGQFTLFANEEKEALHAAVISYGQENKTACIIVGEVSSIEIQNKLKEYVKIEGHCLVACDIKSILGFLPVKCAEQCFDTGVAAYVVNPIRSSYTEEDIALEYAGIQMSPYVQLFGKLSQEKAWEESRQEMISYLCYCALVSLRAYKMLTEELKKTESMHLFKDIEMPLVFTLYDMERRGIRVEKEELGTYGRQLEVRIHELEQEIYARAGEEFNINSPKQLGVILFEKMSLPFAKKTKTGYSTSAEVLEKLRLEDPIVELVLEYRQLSKLKSTYADGLSGYIESDGRIHSTFNQTITATGRISSTEPNLQNIPIRMELGRQIRKVFVPEAGYVFLDADYSQIELRVLAHMAGDKRLIEAYKENADIHRMTASLVFHTPFDEVTDLQRRNAKAVNFGIVYGISGFGLSRDLNITKKEAEAYIKDYFATYPQVKEFMDELVRQGKEKGYVTTMFGRRRPIPELSSGNFMQRQFGERIAMNSPIQGTAADIIKIAMVRVNQRLKEEGLQSRLLLQIHDELLIETKISEEEQVKKILQTEMEQAAELSVPLIAEVKIGGNWYQAK